MANMNTHSTSVTTAPSGRAATRLLGLLGSLGVALIFIFGLMLSMAPRAIEAASSGGLVVTILSAPNLVVDSNALAPSTYSPKAATIAGKFCNTNASTTLTNVMGYIGNFNNGSGSTPGLYPSRTNLNSIYSWASNSDIYSLTHIGGSLGLLDASRYIGTLAPGECKYQYWHFTYPLVNPAHDSPVWGVTNTPDDDLSLRFDVWGTSPNTTVKADTFFTVTMRNEISAMANKIEPNPSGQWFNSNASVVLPGELITSNGILYTFGTINQGFDADNNFIPDYDAWMQPIGDPSFDPSCFRLIRVTGILTVSRNSGNPDYIEYFTDKMYFPNLPQDNTGAIGNVYYTFMALNGPCATALSPYQEVASGSENEKFNGDYGAPVPPPGGYTPSVTITKDGTRFVSLGGFITYTVKLNNKGNTSLGLPGLGVPVVISDSIPPGTSLSGGIFSDTNLTILYSTDYGVSWSSIAPTPLSSVTNVQYWLSDTLPPSGTVGSTVQVTFTVQVTTTPPTKPYITNCAGEQFGSGASMGQACFTTYLTGTYMGGHFVWADLNFNAAFETGEAYITNTTYGVSSTLYYDLNGNNILDAGDPVISTTATLNTTGWYTYSQLYTGTYIVLIDKNSSGIPYGWRATTPITHLLQVSSTTTNYQLANFGFAPSLTITKQLATPVYDRGFAFYSIGVTNLRPGGGDQVGNSCRYTVWSDGVDAINSGTGQKVWFNTQNARFAPDGLYANAPYKNAGEKVAYQSWNLSPQPGNVITVDIILPIRVKNNTATDDLAVTVITATGGAVVSSTGTFNVEQLSSGNLVIPHIAGPWTWTDFRSNARSIVLETTKAGNTNVVFDLDAVGFYVYSDQPCVTAATDDIMTTVPLTDTYDFSKLLFVSSVPTYTSISQSTGVITWSNIGPINPGETKNVLVTFFVSDTAVVTDIVNSTCTTGTTFSDGGFANNGCAKVTGKITPTGEISGVVWSDANNNGWQGTTGGYDSSDYRIQNATVYLYACQTSATSGVNIAPANAASGNGKTCTAAPQSGAWVTITSQTTDQNGYYQFTGLLDGFYVVEVVPSTLPSGFTATADPSNIANGTGQNCATSFNGLTNCTNSWGRNYATLELTPTASTRLYPIVNANTITQVNFGYTGNAVIYGTIWQDYNGDGSHQTNEIGLDNGTAGVTVTLRSITNTIILTTQTDANGYYQFTGLVSGTYTVTVVSTTLPTDGGTWSQTEQGINYASGCPPCTGLQSTQVFTGEIKGSYDFGYHRSGPLVIGDTVYYDWNGNGVQDGNEEGIISVTLTLYRDANGTGTLDGTDPAVMTATTSITGFYLFTGIPSRTAVVTYFVSVDTAGTYFPVNVIQTGDPDEVGTCQVCNSIGRAEILTQSIYTEDFGYQPYGTGAIGDTVYRDMNGDGTQNGVLETGIQSITVRLYVDMNNDGTYVNILTATTNSTGYYLFTGLPYTVTYKVMVDSADTDLPKDSYNSTYIPSTPITVTHQLTNSMPFLDADFGFMPMGAIGDTVYWDNNGNGTQDTGAGEGGIGGIVITLTNLNTITPSNGIPIAPGDYKVTQTTNITGFYVFTGLVTGTYSITVGITPTVGARLTGDPDGYDVPCVGINTARACDSMSKVILAVGAINMSQDFGYKPLGVIGDFVFKDLNRNSQQDPGEPGVAGVVITITNNGTTYTTTTDFDGKYSFSNLPVDSTWLVTFTQPANYTFTVSSNTAISNGVGSVGITATVYISTSGQVSAITTTNVTPANCTGDCSLHVDSGLESTGIYSVNGHVFYDQTGDGLLYGQHITDTGYLSITVYLYDGSNNLVGTTYTDVSGTFTFTNLAGGGITYTVSYNSLAPALVDLTKTADPDVTTANSPLGVCSNCNNYSSFQITSTNVVSKDFGLYGSLDFGDLPNTYKTLLSVEGPRAVLSSTLYLGASPQTDAEGDGQPTSGATGDNTGGTDDENGVARVNPAFWVPNAVVSLTVKVVNTTGYSPTLYGWFDWNNNGVFDTVTETVNFGSVVSGTQLLTMTLPAGYAYSGVPRTLGARFRIYDGLPVNPQPTGLALSAPTGDLFVGSSSIGEVEDYMWPFGPTAITLQTMTATSNSNTLSMLVLAIAALLSAALLFGLSRRRKVA